MERMTKSVTWYCRESKCDKKGLAPIECSITVNGKRSFMALPMKVKPSEFNAKKQPKHITEYVDAWKVRLIEIETEMVANAIPLTPENIKKLVRSGGVVSCTVRTVADEFLKDLKHRAECPVYRKYEMVFERLVRELENKEIKQVTNGEIQRFYTGLCRDYKPMTSSGMFQKVRSLFKFALADGKIVRNPCEGIRVSRGKVNIDFLTVEEIETLVNAQIPNDALQRTLDVFIMMCATGLAYCDIARLRKEDMSVTEDGTYYIHKSRQKTGTEYTAVVLPFGLRIWEKYDGNLPVLSNQKMNLNLTMIEGLLGLKKHLHNHLGRHSYGMLLLNSGVRIETVAECLGHRDIKVTMNHYAKLQKNTVIREVSSIFQK